MKAATWFWWKTCALGRRLLLIATHVNDPWDGGKVDLKRPAVRKMIARAIVANRRELRGVRIVRKYSRDPVVERRERLLEQQPPALPKRAPLRMVG